ncbi:hypothetical protein A2U01_0118419, partial [Trifolium medium]|nr:hypothetical protein [Trifolium medium]
MNLRDEPHDPAPRANNRPSLTNLFATSRDAPALAAPRANNRGFSINLPQF